MKIERILQKLLKQIMQPYNDSKADDEVLQEPANEIVEYDEAPG